MTTIRDVARQAGVSTATVSYVLNDGPRTVRPATRERVERAIATLGYLPNQAARRLAGRNTRAIAVVLGLSASYVFSGPYFSELLLGMSEAAAVRGYSLALETNRDRTKGSPAIEFYRRILSGQSVDGAILGLVSIANLQALESMLADASPSGLIPFVVLEPVGTESRFTSVTSDLERSIRSATAHLIGLGHRRLAFIGGDGGYLAGRLRPAYFRSEMERQGVPVDERLVVSAPGTQTGGVEAMRRLLADRPTAVIAGNDMLTLGAMSAVRAAGLRIPDDLALIGFDGRYGEHLQPPLSAIRLPGYDIGLHSANLLLDLIEGRSTPPQRIVLPSEFIVRESCGSQRALADRPAVDRPAPSPVRAVY
jgi:LacI family transcriptional regulator